MDQMTDSGEISISKYHCYKCEINFSNSSNLSRHNRNTHGDHARRPSKLQCPESGCNATFSYHSKLECHLQIVHDHNIQKEFYYFKNEKLFEQWRNSLKQDSFSSYTARNGKRQKRYVLYCHRSDSLPKKGNGKRRMKKQGSIKIGRTCPSKIIVSHQNTGNGINVTYVKTHIGHDPDVHTIGLTAAQQEAIAQCRLRNMSPHEILSAYKEKAFSVQNLKRLDLLTPQDIRNIDRKFNIKRHTQLTTEDAIRVDAVIKSLEEDDNERIIMYKSANSIVDEYPEYDKMDFAIGLMNEQQQKMLELHGSKLICFDTLHAISKYNYYLGALLVADDNDEVSPVAFLVSSRKDEIACQCFFNAIYTKSGKINSQVFMSDDDPAFYNAWKSVMGEPRQKLICSWHIYHHWQKHLNLLKKEFRDLLKIELQAVLKEKDVHTFQLNYEQLLIKLNQNEVMEPIGKFFAYNYSDRLQEWAFCYRAYLGENIHAHLESLHKRLKAYFQSKQMKRLDFVLNAVKQFPVDKQLEYISFIKQNKAATADIGLKTSHDKSLDADFSFVLSGPNNENCCVVQSFTKLFETYKVSANDHICKCKVRCNECNICSQAYKCECYDNSVKKNVCKHIHLIGRYVKELVPAHQVEETVEIDYVGTFIEVEGNMHEEQKQESATSHCEVASINNAKENAMVLLQKLKDEVDASTTLEEVNIITNNLNKIPPMLSTFRSLNSEPQPIYVQILRCQ